MLRSRNNVNLECQPPLDGARLEFVRSTSAIRNDASKHGTNRGKNCPPQGRQHRSKIAPRLAESKSLN